MALLSLFRHWHYLSHTYDLGFYVQDVWAIGAGIWRNTIFGFHVFDDHFSPVLILLAPLSRVPTAEALLIIQAAAVASGVVPAFRLGSRYGGRSLGLLGLMWYALSAAIWHAIAYDFHPVTLGVPLLMWLINAVDNRSGRVLPIILAVLLALVREDLAVLAGLVLVQGAALKGRLREGIWGLLPASIGVGYIAWATLSSNIGGYHLWTRFSGTAALSGLELLAKAGGNLLRADALISFGAVLLPMLVFPALMGWKRSWPGLTMMFINGLASYPAQASLYYQYFAPVVPFLIWGAVTSWRRVRRASAKGLATVASISLFASLGPIIYVGYGLPDRFVSTIVASSDRRGIAEVLATIPSDESVSATDFLVPHLSRRREIYPFPGPMICLDSLIFHVDHTKFPRYVAVEWLDTVPGMDWRAFLSESGYRETATNEEVSVWILAGRPPASVPCPSMEEVRRRLEE